MGDKDLTERKLLGRNDVFADVFNAIVFKGRQVIKPDDLKDMDPKSQYRDSEGKKREFQRDVVKYWMSGASYLAICDLEPQTKKNRDMVLRLFAYDGVLYHDQITLFPDSTRVPVITLVVYFEKEPWNKYLRLSDVVQFPPDSKELLLPYFNDFKINVIDVPRLTREQIALFQSDLRICAAFLHNVVNPHDVIPITDPTFDDYQSVCDFLNSICKGSGFKIDNEVFSQLPLEEQNMNSIMQMFFDQLYQKAQDELAVQYEITRQKDREEERQKSLEEGRQEGIKEGRQEGIKEGRQEGIKEGRQEGIKEGRRKGIKEGRRQATEEVQQKIVLQLASEGFTPEQIADMLKFELQQVKEWLK